MIYESYVKSNKTEFLQKIRKISKKLAIEPNWLMAAMKFESNINPAAVNSISGATGLIQFMPTTAVGLGTTTAQLKRMTNVQQLDYVYEYLSKFKNKMNSPVDVYLSIFYPKAVDMKINSVIGGSRSGVIASQNKGFDVNNDNEISKKEIQQVYYQRLPELSDYQKKKKVISIIAFSSTAIALAIMTTIIFIYIKKN